MSISVDKLSLLDSLVPLQQKPDSSIARQENGFAGRLDKALGIGEASSASAGNTARKLAETLTLQMLQSSISLAGDTVSDGAASGGTSSLSSANALLRVYRANLAAAGEQPSLPPAAARSQLHELSNDMPVPASTAAETSQSHQSHADTAWLDPIIAKASRKYGVDVGLIKAVIKAESNFNTQAVSHAGARGLMQLMPATARSLGVSDSFDPEQNVMAGTRFLKDMLQRYDGNVDSALAAYNWGPGNVDRRPDSLPRETRDYLARVKQLYASYNV